MATIMVDVVSAEESVFSGEADFVALPGDQGELGILPGHTPLITRIKPGYVRVTLENGENQEFYVSGGILEVQPQLVSVLADTAVRADDLDQAAAQRAKEEAERALADRTGEVEIAEAQARLAEAAAQLRALEQLRKQVKRR